MTDGLEREIESADDAAAARDEVLEDVRSHAGRAARELALLEGGDYGRETFDTDGGSWTLKYEGGDVQYLRYEPRTGGETYVVSTREPPEPEALATALADYDAFVAAFNAFVASYDDVLADVPTEFPEVASTAEAVAERDRIVARIREVADAMADELHRYGDSYGSYTTTVSGTRWELKWEEGRTSYLRIGGEGGVYLLSQYSPATPEDLRRYADDVGAFVEAFNGHVADLEADLDTVSL
ncbi:hypothetical protein [Saliphagus sp. LR7]|uniref:hypothetical protein n=1 Tax=Saliphagus sp. LR7 TaxID=2282654 RepID=UPI000DF72347|nr:hypothetical protein [Saliphagus sp. LR7]